MPTLYTLLRAQHRHTIPVRGEIERPAAKKPVSRLPFLSGVRNEFEAVLKKEKKLPKRVKPQREIIVVGGGLAGLCAAYELQGLGYQVKVFEVRDRVGGRVHSDKDFVHGKAVERGGELIGSNHPLWGSYKEHFELDFSEVKEYGNSPVRMNGKTLTYEESSALTDEVELLLKKLSELAECIVDPFEPWANRDAKRLDAVSVNHWIRRQKCKCKHGRRRCQEAVAEMLTADNGVPADEQSLLGVLAMVKGGGLDRYWTDTEVYRCKGGNDQLAKCFAAALNKRRKGTVTLKSIVKSISQTGGKAIVRVEKNGKTEPYEAHDIILAIPPSVWYKISFRGVNKPKELSKPPEMGRNVKFLMKFEKRFWEDFSSSPTLTEDGPVDITWETTEAYENRDFAMVAFSGAKDADECAKGNNKRRVKAYMDSLEVVYPGIRKQLRKHEFENWPKKEWIEASYYFPRVNEVTKWGPFWKAGYGGWLHFAGEHTSYAFMGYMEGALSSGYRLARRLAVRDKLLPA